MDTRISPLTTPSFPSHVRSNGDVAITGYSLLSRKGPVVLMKCRLYTGKTHQIRVHLKDGLGIEILNDGKYGNRRRTRGLDMDIDEKALYLHCWRMRVPVGGEEMCVGQCVVLSCSSLRPFHPISGPCTTTRIALFL